MNSDRSAIGWLCGGVLTLVGGVFAVIGFWMFNNMDYVYKHGTGDVAAMPFIFSIMGVCLLVSGIALLIYCVKKERKRKWLLENGQYVMAKVTGAVPDFTVRINRRPTYRVECSYVEPSTGSTKVFYSRNFVRDLSSLLLGSPVRVYVDKENRDSGNYYVDIDTTIKEKKLH